MNVDMCRERDCAGWSQNCLWEFDKEGNKCTQITISDSAEDARNYSASILPTRHISLATITYKKRRSTCQGCGAAVVETIVDCCSLIFSFPGSEIRRAYTRGIGHVNAFIMNYNRINVIITPRPKAAASGSTYH